MKILVLPTLFLCVVLPFRASASGNSYTAASCNSSDVDAVINGPTHTAVNGDTIQLPACPAGVTWSSGITISGVCINIIGSGTPSNAPAAFGAGTINMVLIDAIDDGNTPLFKFVGVPYSGCGNPGPYMRISTMEIEPASTVTNGYSPISIAGSCASSGCPQLRIDNLEFLYNKTVDTQATWMLRADNVYGVVDHITIPSGYGNGTSLANVNNSAWLGVGDHGDNSWATADTFGSASQLYFENNATYTNAFDCDESPPRRWSRGMPRFGAIQSIPVRNGKFG